MRQPLVALVGLAFAGCSSEGERSNLPYIDEVVSFEAGDNAGFGADALPTILAGPPRGTGRLRGSTDTLSLGRGGELVVELGRDVVDGEGIDLIVFENAFFIGGNASAAFVEPAIVGVSEDGMTFVDWACDPAEAPFAGCAGLRPVFANGEVTGDPEIDGGDAFDLADIGVSRARFVRIRDGGMGTGVRDEAPNAGFDLDAIYVVNAASAL